MDLPYHLLSRAGLFGGDFRPAAASSIGETAAGAVASGIGSWGSNYLFKHELEERLRSGKTLPAPIWRRQDVQLMLLLPMDRQRFDFRAVPVGGMLRLGLFQGQTVQEDPK